MLYCDAKHSDILRGSSHVRCYLFFGDYGEKWVQRFRSWNSKICYIYIYIYIYIYQKLINEMRWTFPCWYKFRKDKYWVNNYWLGMLKNVRDLLDHGTLKSGVSHKWCDEPSWLNEWFLHADSDWIIFGLTTNLLYIFDICCSCTC